MSTAARLGPETRPVWVSALDIQPSPENELIYRPVSPHDPGIQELAQSIRKHGLKEPIVLSRDRYIISGHRRFAACQLLGMQKIRCRVEDIDRNDPRFETMLREFNRQRVKSFAEVAREAVIDIEPGRAYESLIEHRKANSRVNGEFIAIKGEKSRNAISPAKSPMLLAIKEIVSGMRPYWPLSDRTIHYELLNVHPLRHASKPDSRYMNNRQCYQDLCDLLTRARLSGAIPFSAIEDPTRKIATWSLHSDVGGFLEECFDGFLEGYWRDLLQSQPNHIEIVGEKNTIEGSIRDVAMKFCMPYTLGRGYCSLDPRYKMCQRFKESGKEKLIILVLSDFDPEGEDIAHSFARSMRDDFGIREIVAKKVCLTYEQVRERNLPPNFDAKKTSSRYKQFALKHGNSVYELEALRPSERARLLTAAIDEVIDVDAFNRELTQESLDAAQIEGLRKAMIPLLRDYFDKPKGGKA
jgi:hypothetical protein